MTTSFQPFLMAKLIKLRPIDWEKSLGKQSKASNDLIVSGAGSDAASWDVGFYNAGDGGIRVSGTATVVSCSKLGRSIQDNTFG